MVKLAPLVLALSASIAGTLAAFQQSCNVPYDTCGWILQGPPYSYDVDTLKAAVAAAGKDPNNGTLVFDGLYSCDSGGAIEWLIWCGSGGCDPPIFGPNANCRNGPVTV